MDGTGGAGGRGIDGRCRGAGLEKTTLTQALTATEDTVFALATPPGRSGVAVVRISGPAARAATGTLCPSSEGFPARRACLANLRRPADGEVLDEALVLMFPGPHSFTGEDVVELHLHGGPAVIAGVIEALAAMPGLRPAEPGEFSRRAFLTGKLDLTQAEGLADLVAAETAAQRRQALRQLDGALGEIYEAWRAELIALLAQAEAAIDFVDEDLPGDLGADAQARIAHLRAEMAAHLDDQGRGERLREGFYIAIVGPPNVGKSSLLNRLARREAAIVSETAGTTRDVIEVHLDLGGYPVILADTAGLREARDDIEREGVRRALARAAAADLTLLVGDAREPEVGGPPAELSGQDVFHVMNKSDLVEVPRSDGFWISVKTGDGVEVLIERLATEVRARFAVSEAAALTRARHRQAVETCVEALARAETAEDEVLRAEDLRLAARALGRITGRLDVEDILDVVFAEFCIGK